MDPHEGAPRGHGAGRAAVPQPRRTPRRDPMSAGDHREPHERPGWCTARSKRTRRPCGQRAGAGTDHSGVGACRWHGGATPMVHGGYSKIPRARLGDLLDRFVADPSWREMRGEVALVRASIETFVEQHAEKLGSPDLGEAAAATRVVSELVERATKVLERIDRAEAANAISQPEFFRLMAHMGRVVEMYVRDQETLEKIRQGWTAVATITQATASSRTQSGGRTRGTSSCRRRTTTWR